ncbi:MAG: chemotaxis protein CheX [Mahellales bacterium]
MKAEYVNSFIQSSLDIIQRVCGLHPQLGKVYLKDSPFSAEHIIVIIGVTGDIRGQVQLNMSRDTARAVVSNMMGGMDVVDLNDMAKSALGELGNMIMGNTCTLLAGRGIKIDITPPTVLSGDGMEVSNKTKTLCIPLKLGEYGKVEIGVSTTVDGQE